MTKLLFLLFLTFTNLSNDDEDKKNKKTCQKGKTCCKMNDKNGQTPKACAKMAVLDTITINTKETKTNCHKSTKSCCKSKQK